MANILRKNFRCTISVDHLPKADYIGHCDPYCKIFHNGEQQHQTEEVFKVKQASFLPFILTVYDRDDEILVKVIDHDSGSKVGGWSIENLSFF